MKKFLTTLISVITAIIFTGFNNLGYAKDVLPTSVSTTITSSVGLYQVSDDVTVYKEPDENSVILYRVRWNSDEFFPEDIGFEKFFTVFLPKKSLALVEVTDMTDDWIEIIYNNSKRETGWIKKDDPYKFMTWINFYNVYGKKYGLKLLTGAPESCKYIKSGTDENAQTLSQLNHPQKINLNIIRGNKMLVSVSDLDRTPKTGYVRWRSDDGIRYYFPAIK